jgi:hypothetical protein
MLLHHVHRQQVDSACCALCVLEDSYHILWGWDDVGVFDADYYEGKWTTGNIYDWVPIEPYQTLQEIWHL